MGGGNRIECLDPLLLSYELSRLSHKRFCTLQVEELIVEILYI